MNRDSGTASDRLDEVYRLRIDAARKSRAIPVAPAMSNGDESRYKTRIASFTKGLPHDATGLVQPEAYRRLLRAVQTGAAADFEAIPVASTHMPLVNPQGGLCLGMAGLDASQFQIPPAPAFDSAERAAEHAECHWMYLVRDVPFADYAGHPDVAAACEELSRLPGYTGPKHSGRVSAANIFRGGTTGDRVGPYVSQFLLQPIRLGALPISHQIWTYLPVNQGGHDYLTDFDSWLSIQNGEMPMEVIRRDPLPRYIRSGRDLCAYVHMDFTYQAFFNASVWLANRQARVNPGSPYPPRRNQTGFATYGIPDAQSMLAMAHLCALRAVWFQKWIVHRTLRPEEFGGRVHFALTRQADDGIHADLLNSQALARSFERTRGYFLPQAFPEGCPQHPSYAQGHATCAGACATVLKAFFDGSTRIMELGDVYEAARDGRTLVPYRDAQAGMLTVAGELDKLAGNIAIGRNFAGIHWRSDYLQGLLLGEAVALALIREARRAYPEPFSNLRIRKMDGDEIAI